jgi:hypothetical protein
LIAAADFAFWCLSKNIPQVLPGLEMHSRATLKFRYRFRDPPVASFYCQNEAAKLAREQTEIVAMVVQGAKL